MAELSVELVLSVGSFAITIYFWFVQARRERPQLRIYQIGSFRAVCRKNQQRDDVKRLCVQQMDSHGVLIANNSIRQNSIVLFHCWFVLPDGREIPGDWGAVGDDHPPWNIGPEESISIGLACFFDVSPDFVVPDTFEIDIEFISASGRKFEHTFNKETPAFKAHSDARISQAA